MSEGFLEEVASDEELASRSFRAQTWRRACVCGWMASDSRWVPKCEGRLMFMLTGRPVTAPWWLASSVEPLCSLQLSSALVVPHHLRARRADPSNEL